MLNIPAFRIIQSTIGSQNPCSKFSCSVLGSLSFHSFIDVVYIPHAVVCRLMLSDVTIFLLPDDHNGHRCLEVMQFEKKIHLL